jgi:Transglutaminase-like superfamily
MIARKITLFLATLFISASVMAQDFPYGKVDNKALQMKKYDKDTSAHAVVLQEYGSSSMALTSDNELRITFEYHAKIKFFDNKEFDSQGTVIVPIYENGNSYEDVREIKGITFYTDDNGLVQAAELDPKKVFRVQENKHWSTLKFAMPALRSGCVIEINYKVVSPYIYNFHSWNFQTNIPKVNSEYEVHIPGFWSYNASLKGGLKLTKNKATVETKCFSFGIAHADCSDIIYGISDVPAFIAEDYMTSEKNFKSAINFELEEETDFDNGNKIKYSKDWKAIDYLLKGNNSFGSQLKRKDLMKERIMPLIVNKTDELEKASAIYTYIKNTIKWNERYDFSSDDGIRKALDNHTGNSGDINLALVTALNSAGIPTEAVLLSTRANGTLNNLYPNLNDFDYVVAKVNIGDKSYFLDATDPLLPFGMLPLRCLNDHGRAFSLDKPSYWVDMTTQQREKTNFTYDLTLQDNGKLKGTMTRYSIGYSSYLKRKEIKKFNSVNEYVENLDEKLPKLKILKSNIVNLDSLDMPLGESYEVEIDAYDNLNNNRLRFNPFMLDWTTTNPFKLVERDYPVDWGMPSDERFVLTLHLSPQYIIENPFQNLAFTMPNNGGKFLTYFESNNNTFTFSYATQFNKSIYGVEEYPFLKELYNKIVLSEKNDIVLKKKL